MTEPAPWTRIYNRVKSQIPAAPDALIREEVYSVTLDFTQDTNMWVENVPFTLQPGVVSYPLTLQGFGTPYRLLLVYNVDPTQTDIQYKWADSGITMRIPGTVVLARAPTEALNWVAVIAKQVNEYRMVGVPPASTGYPEVDDWIVNTNQDTLYYGSLYFLQRMASKPFNNPTLARENQLIYNSQKSAARVNNMRSNVYGGQAWQYPQGFRAIARKGWV